MIWAAFSFGTLLALVGLTIIFDVLSSRWTPKLWAAFPVFGSGIGLIVLAMVLR